MLCEGGDHQIDVHLRQCLRATPAPDSISTSSHAETIGVELLVPAWLGGAPQVQIEDARQLAGCRQRHQLAAILESTVLNDPVKDLGRQSGDDVRQVRRVQDAIEQITRVPGLSLCGTVALPARAAGARCGGADGVRATTRGRDRFRHAPGDDTGPGGQQTVLNGGGR